MTTICSSRTAAIMLSLTPAISVNADTGTESEAATSTTVTGYYYAMRDQPDFGVGVASVNRGQLHLEARYNYEAQHSASLFAGWNFAGGDGLSFAVAPLVGALGGDVRGVVPGVEASLAYRDVDAYIEAEYVYDLDNHNDSYFYSWTEVGWKPLQWLRVGLVGQRSHSVSTGRELQRGAFLQLIIDKVTLGFYAFNPESGSRYAIVSLGAQF